VGSTFASKKPKDERPLGDFYPIIKFLGYMINHNGDVYSLKRNKFLVNM